MTRWVVGAVCCVLLVAGVGLAATTATTASYSVTIPGSIDVPDRTVTVDEDTYTVQSIARATPGENLTVETTGPDDESYRVYVHTVSDGSRDVYEQKFIAAEDSGTITLQTDVYDPGSYVVSIYHDGTFYSPHPLIVPAYETTITVPDTVPASESATLSATLTELEPGHTVESVEFVVSNSETTKRVTATDTDDTYEATLDLGDLDPDSYHVHAVVYSPDQAPDGEHEVIGISDTSAMAVEAEQQTTTTKSSGDGNPGGGGGETSTTPPSTAPPTTTSPVSTTQPTTSTANPTTKTTVPGTTTEHQPATTSPTSSTDTKTTGDLSTTDAVLTPNTSSPPSTTSNGAAGEMPLLLLAILAAIALFVRSAQD